MEASSPPPGRAETPAPPTQTKIDASQAERLKRIMVPLIKAMDHPRPLDQVKIGVLDDQQINAASAGGGEFYVTAGLLKKANDEQLMAILAHEIAHDDLGHVAKAQALGAGLGIGAIILDQIIPGSGQIAPIAGALISRTYSRKEEYEADQHGGDPAQAHRAAQGTHAQNLDLADADGRHGRRRVLRHPSRNGGPYRSAPETVRSGRKSRQQA